MAKLVINDEEYQLPDGARIDAVCEEAGVLFSCNSGACGTCQVDIVEGAENLNELSDEEMDLGLDRNKRLSCQCVIKSGTVKITF